MKQSSRKSFEKELSVKYSSQDEISVAAKVSLSFKSDAEGEMSEGALTFKLTWKETRKDIFKNNCKNSCKYPENSPKNK